MAMNPKPGESTDIKDMSGVHNDIGEKSGFQTSGYIVKKGTPSGDGAMFNFLPPGMDITNQVMTDQRNMPMKRIVDESYPGDGWPGARDVTE